MTRFPCNPSIPRPPPAPSCIPCASERPPASEPSEPFTDPALEADLDAAPPPARRPRIRRCGTDPIPCAACGAATTEPRDRLCSACYQRRRRGTLVLVPCEACGEADPRVIRLATLASGPAALCCNCIAIAGRRTLTLTVLRSELRPSIRAA